MCTCRAEIPLTAEHAARLPAGIALEPETTIFVPVRCPACDNTGYKGRVGIYELLILDDPVRAAIRRSARLDEVRAVARSGGLRVLHEDALEKVKAGVTSLKEVLRAVPFDQLTARLRQHAGAGSPAVPSAHLDYGLEKRESAADGPGASIGHRVAPHARRVQSHTHLRDLSIIYNGCGEEIPVHPPALSTRGMFVNTAHPFPEDAVLKVRFQLARSNYSVDARCRVRYCLPGVGVGVEFVEISPEARRAIQEELRIP